VKKPRIFFSVGEPSGDLHAARLIESLRAERRDLTFTGLGGPKMKQAGCQIEYPLTDLAVMGFVEVLPKLREFQRVANLASRIMDIDRPEAVILVDFPGFNWHIARRAKKRGIPVYYYLPPQMWAWGQWRIHKMRKYVDHILCNLPFEQKWYEQRGVSAHNVGHPFFDQVHQQQLDHKFLNKWRREQGVQVAVLPGSRAREVRSIWPIQLAAIRELSRRHPGTHFMVACLKDAHCIWCKRQMTSTDNHLNIDFFVGKTSEIIEIADCSLMKSGSVSLEMMARGVPSVVVYHVGRIFYQIARRLTNLDTITLPNMLAGRTVMPEFLAVGSIDQTVTDTIAAMDRLIGDPQFRESQRTDLIGLSAQHASSGASSRAARVILTTLRLPQGPMGQVA
jgi:lipid-A-disaccharide synthase